MPETLLNRIDDSLLPPEVIDVLSNLQGQGYPSFLVGGCIRDLLLGRIPSDYDICSAAQPEDVQELFRKVIPLGRKFATVLVLQGEQKIEVTSFRDGNMFAGDTRLTSAVERDVQLRDFTINAILYDGTQLIDYVNGLTDLHLGVIRGIGQPGKRFKEDPLRLLRAVRLAGQLGFSIECDTFNSIKVLADQIKNIAPERIRDELVHILLSDNPVQGIRLCKKTGILQFILPELQKCCGFEQYNTHHDKDVFEHTMAVLSHTPSILPVRLAALFHDIGKPSTFTRDVKGIGHFYGHNLAGEQLSKEILQRLRFDTETVDSVALLVKEHMNRLEASQTKAIKRLINRVGKDKVNYLFDLQLADIAGSAVPNSRAQINKVRNEANLIIAAGIPLKVKDLAINGDDLMHIGLRPGPEIRKVLAKLLERVLENPLNNEKHILLGIVEQLLLGSVDTSVTGVKEGE